MPLFASLYMRARTSIDRSALDILRAAGKAATDEMRRASPVDTGRLKASLNFTETPIPGTDAEGPSLLLHASVPMYGFFQDRGTRHQAGTPFVDRGLLVARRGYGVLAEVRWGDVTFAGTRPLPLANPGAIAARDRSRARLARGFGRHPTPTTIRSITTRRGRTFP